MAESANSTQDLALLSKKVHALNATVDSIARDITALKVAEVTSAAKLLAKLQLMERKVDTLPKSVIETTFPLCSSLISQSLQIEIA